MRDDERFEIERAFDLLPHVAGASWAAAWFRMSGNKSPTRAEFRAKAAEYFGAAGGLYGAFDGLGGGRFGEMSAYIRRRRGEEERRILDGSNREIEKRYDRYVDYG